MTACVFRCCVIVIFLAMNGLIIGAILTREDNPVYTTLLEDVPAFDVHSGRAVNEHSVRVRRGVSADAVSGTTRVDARTTQRIPSTKPAMTTSAPSSPLNTTVTEERNHTYYKTRLVTGSEARGYFVNHEEMKKHGLITHVKLSASHRTAVSRSINFTFPFYGHDLRTVSIATGGFLYMSNFFHKWLTATQYVAPLMANFDTSIGNKSLVHYADNGTALIVLWENVHLQDDVAAGPFTFEVILHKDGTIIFSYYQIPVKVSSISSAKHPVKVGLSDAYYIDRHTINGVKHRTIYEYHNVKINMTVIANHTAVIITPLPTCNIYKTCSECLTASINSFKCTWCPTLRRCSSGLDRKRQEWLENSCHLVNLRVDQCPDVPSTMSNAILSTESPVTTASPTFSAPASSTAKSPPSALAVQHSASAKPGVIIAILLVVCLVGGLASWLLYAYLKPQSKSGLWLIEHRPSRLREQLSKVWFRKDRDSTDA